jgi:HAD superfamily hydrolase (TIGR01662 family)
MLYMFDVDGTLIEGFLRNWKKEGRSKQPTHHTDVEKEMYDKVTLLPGRRDRIHQLATNDPHACFALVTNQGGVAWGFQTVDQVEAKMAKVIKELDFFFRKPFSVHISYVHPNAALEEWRGDDGRRKPSPGMLDEAMQAHRLVNRATAIMVGDMETDQQAAMEAGVTYMDESSFFA